MDYCTQKLRFLCPRSRSLLGVKGQLSKTSKFTFLRAFWTFGTHSVTFPVLISFNPTIKFLSFWTDRPGQTDQGLHCLPFWTLYSMIKSSFSNFKVLTVNVLGVRIFRSFKVIFSESKKIDKYCKFLKFRTPKNLL